MNQSSTAANAVAGILLISVIALTQALPTSHGSMVRSATGTYHSETNAGSSPDDWPTYHRDMFRSGYDPNIPQFTTVSLHWKSTTLDDELYTEPLVVGTAVVVATENNSLYELNATTGQVVWRTHLGAPVNGGILPCGDINPSGITGTPVIDDTVGTIFAVAYLQATNGTLYHELFAVNLNTGSIKFQMPIDPQGADVLYQQQRGALALANGYVYVPYGGLDGDCGPYHGWLTATKESGGGPVISFQVPTGRAGAIWGGGDGPVVDSSGNLLVATGNSDATSTFDFGDSVMKLSPAMSPPMSIVDWFAPTNWASLNSGDLDLGSTEPVILSSTYVFQIGKEGVGYLLNAANLGHIGGQLYSAQVCSTGGGAYGGLAYEAPYLVVPCGNGFVALNVTPASNPPWTVAWRGPSYLTGPPIIAGNAVWDVDAGNRVLYAFSLTSGQTLFQASIGSLPTQFTSLSAGDGQIFVPANRQVWAYQPLQATMPSITEVGSGSGYVSPNRPGPNGCSDRVGASVSVTATARLDYLFSSWAVTGASCSGGTFGNPCQFTMPNNAVTVSASFVQSTSIAVTPSPSSVSVGSLVTLSGAISPDPEAATVVISYSLDSGSVRFVLLSVTINGSGAYSAT